MNYPILIEIVYCRYGLNIQRLGLFTVWTSLGWFNYKNKPNCYNQDKDQSFLSLSMSQTKPLLKYDLACGQRKQAGHMGVDIADLKQVDIVYDLTHFPWNFAKDSSTESIYCGHFFEHLTGQQRIDFMHELYRILIPGGTAEIITPYYTSVRASQDPTHQWPPISEASYAYFNRQWRQQNLLDHYPIHCDFDYSVAYTAPNELKQLKTTTFQYRLSHHWNSVYDLQVTLTKR